MHGFRPTQWRRKGERMRKIATVTLSAIVVFVSGCAPFTVNERNPFVVFSEEFGVPGSGDATEQGPAGVGAADFDFRRTMSLTLINNHPDSELNTSFMAWVEIGSLRNAEQQDALLRNGYVALTREVSLGNVFSLPPGTFVFKGSGFGGATDVKLGPTVRMSPTASTQTFDLITPDVVLVFSQPPVSCESVAFFYTVDGAIPTSPAVPDKGAVILFEGSTGGGPLKTLAQVDAYQCSPLRPGLFLKLGGGAREANAYFEGENITMTFNAVPDAEGFFANVVITP